MPTPTFNCDDPKNPSGPRLESWKEIAAYLKRDVRTVIRWEKAEGLPVHRHLHRARASVYAFPAELAAWWASRSPQLAAAPAVPWWKRGLRLAATVSALLLCAVLAGHGPAMPMRAEAQRSGPTMTELGEHGKVDRFSPDGKMAAGTDWSTGNLVVLDLESQRIKPLTDTNWQQLPTNFAESAVWSPDSQHIAYCWYNGKHCELRVIPARGGEPRVVYAEAHFFPADWSPDGKHILGYARRRDRKYTLAVVALSGERRDLRELETVAPYSARFSPDGRYVAYDDLRDNQSGVFVLSLEQRSEARLLDPGSQDHLADWTRDGGRVLVLSNRSGRWDLLGMPVREGKAAGEPAVLYADVGEVTVFKGWQDEQSLVFGKATAFGQFYSVALDPSTGALVGAPARPVRQFLGRHVQASFAPDGRTVALLYESATQRGTTGLLAGARGGELQAIPTPSLRWKRLAGWSGGRPVLSALHASGMAGFYRAGAQGLEAVHEDAEMNWASGELSPDGTLLAYVQSAAEERRTMQIYSLAQRKAVRSYELQPGEEYFTPRFAPDGQALYYLSGLQGGKTWQIMRLPLPEGEVKSLPLEGFSGDFLYLSVSPDGRWLSFVRRLPSQGKNSWPTWELLLVKADGGKPMKLQLPEGHQPWRPVWTPDGKEIGYISWEFQGKAYRLSGFLPKE